jgi:hypothetical protein
VLRVLADRRRDWRAAGRNDNDLKIVSGIKYKF